MRSPLLLLAISTIAANFTELVTVGMMPDVGHELSVPLSQAYWLVSGYALGTMLGPSLYAGLTNQMGRRFALRILMLQFIVGNVLSATAPDFSSLMMARIITSFAHGSFCGIAVPITVSLVPTNKRKRFILLALIGLEAASVLCLTVGTYICQQLGWRSMFLVAAGLGLASLACIAMLLPEKSSMPPNNMSKPLSIAFINLGNAGGVWLTGLALKSDYGPDQWPLAVSALIGAALLIGAYGVSQILSETVPPSVGNTSS